MVCGESLSDLGSHSLSPNGHDSGVHDVGIVGWSNAVVTVTGTAAQHKILKTARKISKNAELWEDPYEHSSHYSHGRY